MNTKHEDGGPAFPTVSASVHLPHHGMTLRDWFAGMALQGLLANPGGPIQANGMSGWSFTNCEDNDVAKLTWILADAMLAARSQTK